MACYSDYFINLLGLSFVFSQTLKLWTIELLVFMHMTRWVWSVWNFGRVIGSCHLVPTWNPRQAYKATS